MSILYCITLFQTQVMYFIFYFFHKSECVGGDSSNSNSYFSMTIENNIDCVTVCIHMFLCG